MQACKIGMQTQNTFNFFFFKLNFIDKRKKRGFLWFGNIYAP